MVRLSWTYAFPTVAWFSGGEAVGFSALGTAQKSVAQSWLLLWDDLIAPHFTNAGTSSTAMVKVANSTTGPSYAYAYYPTSGSVWLNPVYGAGSGQNNLVSPTAGMYGYTAIGHELGHAIGLSHPGDYNGGSPTYANDAAFEQDSRMYTIMSYFDATDTGADNVATNGQAYFPQTPMMNDVLAIQSLYGASTTTRATNTVYGFHSTAGSDTLDLSGFATVEEISLAPGTFSGCDGMTYNLSIALSAVIENAVGGSADDTLTDNDVANVLTGGAGNDMLDGGDDILIGGSGKDILTGGTGADIFRFASKSDSAVGVNRDQIADFSTTDGDKIGLTPMDANSVLRNEHETTSRNLLSGR